MLLKEYQKDTLDTVRGYIEQLADWRRRTLEAGQTDPKMKDVDWVAEAWREATRGKVFVPRRNGLGEPLPSFCLKIPTGGGKTLLATKVIDLVNTHYRRKQTGLTLWIVPTSQIYNQTLRALKDRDHPYRQTLDVASAGRTLILEKTSIFSPLDVAENLCVLLLMLPSANRMTKEQLRMFRDSGGFDQFCPADDDVVAQRDLLARIPNLDTFDDKDGFWGRQIKTSLGNTLRLLSPLIVLDEGHKAYSNNAKQTLEGFNPSMIVELSATPPRGANVLVEVLGKDLNDEEMIKLDLHLLNRSSVNWKDTLLAAIEHRDRLETEAQEHESATGVYIRPICLIQVERTGKDQRRSGLVHADDVKEYLLAHPGITEEQIAIKTSMTDELKAVDEIGGLMVRDCTVRFIITKQALQEGWDCAFAYVLAILTNPGSRSALTQLVGRILRQPYARKTGNPLLDESYVFCFQRKGQDLLKEVRKGFGMEGLGDLQGRIVQDSEQLQQSRTTVFPQEQFQEVAKNLVLPAFMIEGRDGWKPVNYEADILSRVPWDDIDIGPLPNLTLGDEGIQDVEYRQGLETGILEMSAELRARPIGEGAVADIDYAFAASHLLEVVPNPWRSAELTHRVFDSLIEQYDQTLIRANFVFVIEEIRKRLERERDRLAEAVFADLLESGTMRFMVVAEDFHFTRLPKEKKVDPNRRRAARQDGSQFVLGLFDVVNEDEFNELENMVATYLDKQERLFFWYRNRARQGYYVQGWKRHKIFADFIFTLKPDEPGLDDAFHRVFVTETKGLHLRESRDTSYKRTVFDLCNSHAKAKDWSEFVPAMRDKVVRFEVVDEEEWEKRLNTILQAS